jgi:uncharacterized membrane protein
MAEEATQQVTDAAESAGEKVTGNGNGDGSLAKKLLLPAAAGVGTLAATYAARKAPELVRDHVKPKLEQRGGEQAAEVGKQAAARLQGQGGVLGSLAGKAGEKLGAGGGREKTRRLPIQRWTDVAVPVDVAYEKWTQFEEFPKFMHRVLSVEETGDNRLSWQEKIWFSRRQWEGEITDKRKNDRIAWKTTKGTAHAGIVSFHSLDKNLTRIMVTMDFRPSGMIEKMGSGLRFVKRAVQADLARFKAYVEMDDAKGLEYSQPEKGDDESGDESKNESKRESDDQSSKEDQRQSREDRAERREQRRA